jgi:hypothetical protein
MLEPVAIVAGSKHYGLLPPRSRLKSHGAAVPLQHVCRGNAQAQQQDADGGQHNTPGHGHQYQAADASQDAMAMVLVINS